MTFQATELLVCSRHQCSTLCFGGILISVKRCFAVLYAAFKAPQNMLRVHAISQARNHGVKRVRQKAQVIAMEEKALRRMLLRYVIVMQSENK